MLDPFAGVGSSIIAAIKNDRNAVGIERDDTYCKIARQRIANFKEGSLKTRPINKPIHKPTGNDSISKIPAEWLQLEYTNGNGINAQK